MANDPSRWWTKEQQDCPHEHTEWFTDNSCGIGGKRCIYCKAIIESGMMGHN